MANTKIKILRGLKKDLPLLDRGEIAFCTDTEELFAGDGEKNLLLSLSKEQFDELYKTTEGGLVKNFATEEEINSVRNDLYETIITDIEEHTFTFDESNKTISTGLPLTEEYLENEATIWVNYPEWVEGYAIIDGTLQEIEAGGSIGTPTWINHGNYFELSQSFAAGPGEKWRFYFNDSAEYSAGDIVDASHYPAVTTVKITLGGERTIKKFATKEELNTLEENIPTDLGLFNYESAIEEKTVVVPAGSVTPSGFIFTQEMLNNITIYAESSPHLTGPVVMNGVAQGDCVWTSIDNSYYKLEYPLEPTGPATQTLHFYYKDYEYDTAAVGDIKETAIFDVTLKLEVEVQTLVRNFVNKDEVYNKEETDTKFDEVDTKLDEVVGGGGEVDLNSMAYFNYAGSIYGDKYNLLKNAWEHSLTVDVVDKDHYPNGETEGVIIPQGVTNIVEFAFTSWSSNNQPLIIPNSVTSIGDSAFIGWSSNNQPLVIPNSVTSIGSSAFYSWSSNNQPLVIPNSVTSIGSSAFEAWTANNQPLVISNSITNIGGGAFQSWSANNQPLVIPNSVKIIGGGSFFGWASNNQPLVIPDSVTSIGSYAFYGWSLVPYVEMKAITPPTIADGHSFSTGVPIYVPDESVDDYKTATNWVDLADRIFSINDK